MAQSIHQTALAAWNDLRERGGLELDDRDEGLEERLKNRLDHAAPTLEAALLRAPTDDLLRGLFDVLHPR